MTNKRLSLLEQRLNRAELVIAAHDAELRALKESIARFAQSTSKSLDSFIKQPTLDLGGNKT